MPKYNKNGNPEIRAYDLLRRANAAPKGWRRLEAKKFGPRVAYGLYTGIQQSGTVQKRMYYGVIVFEQNGQMYHSATETSGDLLDITDWATQQHRAWRA